MNAPLVGSAGPPWDAVPAREPSEYDQSVSEATRRLSRALDEIYMLRALLADEALITEAHLDLKSFPRGRRRLAEDQVRRMQAAARGVPEYHDGFDTKIALHSAGASETLTMAQWLAANGFDPTRSI